jgi:hypothetical protein
VFSLIGITLVGTGAAAAAARGSFVAMESRPLFVVCCDDAYAPLLDAVLMRVHVKRNAESQSLMQDVSGPVGLPSNNSLGGIYRMEYGMSWGRMQYTESRLY